MTTSQNTFLHKYNFSIDMSHLKFSAEVEHIIILRILLFNAGLQKEMKLCGLNLRRGGNDWAKLPSLATWPEKRDSKEVKPGWPVNI